MIILEQNEYRFLVDTLRLERVKLREDRKGETNIESLFFIDTQIRKIDIILNKLYGASDHAETPNIK